MIGLLVELILSLLILWLFYKENLLVLGIIPSGDRIQNISFGILISAVCGILYYLSVSFISGSTWMANKDFTGRAFGASSWWVLKSVLFEELIFRGALLYVAIKRLGITKACLLSAICFGVYHWFSYGALGNPVQMIIIFFMTGIWGFMYAVSFAKTKSLYLPTGLHFGWNLVVIVVFSQGPLGSQLLISSGGQKLEGIISLVLFLSPVFILPLVVYLYLKRYPQPALK